MKNYSNKNLRKLWQGLCNAIHSIRINFLCGSDWENSTSRANSQLYHRT